MDLVGQSIGQDSKVRWLGLDTITCPLRSSSHSLSTTVPRSSPLSQPLLGDLAGLVSESRSGGQTQPAASWG